jgi:hypothetical protein
VSAISAITNKKAATARMTVLRSIGPLTLALSASLFEAAA